MRNLILTALLLSFTAHGAQAACSIILKKKSATAKSAYINGTSISTRVQAALSTICTVNYKMMSTKDLIQFEQARFDKKIKKLKAQAQMR